MAKTLKGRCLCGATTFTATPKDMEFGACHCGMCRHWSGGVFMSVDCGDTVRFDDDSHLGRYRGTPWGERLFCKQCGSSLVWQTQDGQFQQVSVHAFDNPDDFKLTHEVFHDRKPGNYAFANDTRKMTEAEIFALFAPPEGGPAA